MKRKDIANERLGNEIISFIEISDIEETRNLKRRETMKLTSEWSHPLGSVILRPRPDSKAGVMNGHCWSIQELVSSTKINFLFFRRRRLHLKLQSERKKVGVKNHSCINVGNYLL